MRHGFWVYAALVPTALVMGCHHQPKDQGQGQATAAHAASYRYFRGTIGSSGVVVQLIKYPDHYEGTFIQDSLGQPLPVTGKKAGGDSLELVTYDHYNAQDTFRGYFPQSGVFQGTVTDTAGMSTDFTLQEIYPPGTLHWDVYHLTDSMAFDSSSSPRAHVRYSLLWPGKKGLTESQYRMITDSIQIALYGAKKRIAQPKAFLAGVADSFFTGYKIFSGQYRNKTKERLTATFNWESDMDMKLLWNADSIISLACQSYQYTGGAHGLTNTTLMVFDLRKNRPLRLDDLFKTGYESVLRTALENRLRLQYDLGADGPLNGRQGILFNPHLGLTDNFYVTGGGIGFLYNPYEVAPYSVGQIELYLPFAELRSILK